MRHEMFIYCLYRHVNHLNGSYVMEICLWAERRACGGSEVEASVLELILVPKIYSAKGDTLRKRFELSTTCD